MTKPRQWQPQFDSMLGLKQGYAITNMPPGSCIDIKNMYLNGLGGKTSRGGYVELFHNTNGSGGARITDKVRSIIQYNPFAGETAGTSQVLDYAGTRIFRKNGTATDIVRASLTSDTPWEWLQYRNFILGVNGTTDSSFLYTSDATIVAAWGASYVKISITKPAAQVTTADGGVAGTLVAAANYGYIQTNYDSATGRESEPFSVVDTGTHVRAAPAGPNSSITVTFAAVTAGEGVSHRRLYRKQITGVGAETLYSRIAEVAVATATYTDTGAASTTLYLDYDTGQPDTGNTALPTTSTGVHSGLIAECFDRIFMVDPNDASILVYSKVGDYWSFPTGNNTYVGRGDGSIIKRIEKHGKSLLMHKGNGWYILDSDPVGNYAGGINPGVPKFLSKIGTQDFRTSISAQNQVVRLTPVGFYRSVPTDYDTADLREDYIGNDIATFESAIDLANSDSIVMYNYNAANRRHVYCIEPLSASYYSKCYVYDIVLNQWVYYEIGTDVYSVAKYVVLSKEYMMIGDGYGIVWQWDVGNSDGHSLSYTIANGTATSSANTTLTDTSVVSVNGTATSGGATSLTDTTKTWTVDQWASYQIYIVSGTGSGQARTIVSNTANAVTVAAWGVSPDNTSVYQIGGWTLNGLVGVMVRILEGTGVTQRRRISSNTPDTITITAAWTTNPDTTSVYTIGGIEKYSEEYWDSNGDPHIWKRMRWVVPYIRQTGNYSVKLSARKDFSSVYYKTGSVSLTSSSALWGTMLWGTGAWGGQTSSLIRWRLAGKYHYYALKYENSNADEPFYWDGHGAVFQLGRDRNK